MAIEKKKTEDSASEQIDRLSRVIIALVVGIILGVAISQFGLETLRGQIQNLIFVFIWLVVITGLSAFWIVQNKERILRRIFGVSNTDLSDMYKTAQSLWFNALDKDYDQAKKDLTILLKRATAWYSWMNFRRWVLIVFQSLLVGFGGLLGTILLYNQNKLLTQQNQLLNQQNVRLDQQTYLQEAERRSSLIFLMGNILDAVNLELKEDLGTKGIRDLSPQLTGRIIALSNSLRPYRYLGNDSLVGRELSPERGYLLQAIVSSEIDKSSLLRIYKSADFSFADLKNAVLSGEYLARINLTGANLSGARLDEANLDEASLSNADLSDAVLTRATLQGARLRNSILYKANLVYANLAQANLSDANLSRANLSSADIHGAHFYRTNLIHADLSYAVLNQAAFDEAVIDSARVAEFHWLDSLSRMGPDTLRGTNYLINNYYMDSVKTNFGWFYVLLPKNRN